MGVCANCVFLPEKPWKHDQCRAGISVNGECPRCEFSCKNYKLDAGEVEIPLGHYKVTLEPID